jgi:DNA repair photolyase
LAGGETGCVRAVCEHVFVRWENLQVESQDGARLPGFKEPAVVRTFDAPEAMATRFYEVRARSAINEVPKRSRMPFRFTINPYRGCTHACVYCADGETPVLMADGRTSALADVRVGDPIYGTVPWGRYRRYVITHVQAHWETRKRAYRITLEDGTELIASGDHRFLTDRGWKHVAGAEQGRRRRPHLTLNNKLLGVGQLAAPPAESPDYQRGYLCGLIRGDGHLGSYRYERPGRSRGDVHRFRLALTDMEALRRARQFLCAMDVVTDEFAFATARVGTRPMTAIRTQARHKVDAIRDVIRWPQRPVADWSKGFLAGIFDAEGGAGHGALRIANTDQAIIDWITYCLRQFGFSYAIERTKNANGLTYVRVRGGLRENIRFCLTTDPAITRKRAIAGTAVKGNAPLRVASIEPMGNAQPLYDISTGTGDFIANGVISHNCFARPTHTYLDFNAREDFEREIVVKVNVPELVRAELGRPSWRGDHVALGTNTDPYQWVEGRYKLMEGIWEAMRDFANPCSVLTKSPLLLRDIELMKEIAERTEFTANLSIPTLDEEAWRATEPHTPHPRKRIEAVAELKRAGIRTGVLIAPLIPGVNDSPEKLEPLLELLGDAGPDSIGGVALHLRGEVRDIWFDWLREHRPDLVPRYEELYARGAYMKREEATRLSTLVRRGRRRSNLRGAGRGRSSSDDAIGTEPEEAAAGDVSSRPGRQPRLF